MERTRGQINSTLFDLVRLWTYPANLFPRSHSHSFSFIYFFSSMLCVRVCVHPCIAEHHLTDTIVQFAPFTYLCAQCAYHFWTVALCIASKFSVFEAFFDSHCRYVHKCTARSCRFTVYGYIRSICVVCTILVYATVCGMLCALHVSDMHMDTK